MPDDRPWLRFYGKVPATIDYPEVTLYEALAATARRVPGSIAWDFLGTKATYARVPRRRRPLRRGAGRRRACAPATASSSRCPRRRRASSPSTRPTALGALPALIHPLSTAPEITHYLDATGARMALTLDAFYGTLAAATPKAPLETIVVARIPEYLSPLKRLGFWVTKGRKIPPLPADARVRSWSALLAARIPRAQRARGTTDDAAAILFSGGTTGAAQGHRALQPQLHRRGHAGGVVVRHGREGRDPRDPADLPRLRARASA